MSIKVLPSSIYTKIAAGEVVERPASVVKELIENSIDAKATQIKIEIKNGGIDLIKITDNGTGIYSNDISNVFVAHATSKIVTENDLYSIKTLGFRGEALSSISSISKVVLRTKTKNAEFGIVAENEGGNIVSVSEIGMPQGTEFEVRDLFYNVPARKKFLKKPKTEEDEISHIVERFILGNSNISFEYILNEKVVYNFNSSNLENSIYTVYGKDISANLIEVTAKGSAMSNIVLEGYIGKPSIAKNNRTYQTLFVNGRYVVNQTVSTAINKVFENYLMKGKHPFFVLNLKIPFDKIDVNIHPTKLEVKFENNGDIFAFVYHSINSAILNASKITVGNSFVDENFTLPNNTKKNEETHTEKEVSFGFQGKDYNVFFKDNNDLSVASPTILDEIKVKSLFEETSKTTENKIVGTPAQIDILEQSSVSVKDYRIIGSLFNTFIIIEKGDTVFFIDEHAAHERLNYDILVKNINSNEVARQQLLIPYIFDVNYKEKEFISSNITHLENLGFDIEEFGKLTFKITTVPMILSNINIKSFVDDVLSDSNKTADILKDKLAQKACKSAVKAGDKLTDEQVQILIERMIQSQSVLLCPHGRPIFISFSRRDFDKWFKRIV